MAKKSTIKYDSNIRPVLESNNIKQAERLEKVLSEELNIARLKVSKALFKLENGDVDEEYMKSALNYENYVNNMIGLVKEHIRFLNESEKVILDSVDIEELRKRFMNDEDE